MKNITNNFMEAINANILWNVQEFYAFLYNLQELNYNVSYSEGEENWATISVNNTGIAYVWQKNPLIIIINEMFSNFKELAKEFNYISFVEVSSLDSKELVIHSNQELLDRLEFVDYGIPVSATDIWFATIN